MRPEPPYPSEGIGIVCLIWLDPPRLIRPGILACRAACTANSIIVNMTHCKFRDPRLCKPPVAAATGPNESPKALRHSKIAPELASAPAGAMTRSTVLILIPSPFAPILLSMPPDTRLRCGTGGWAGGSCSGWSSVLSCRSRLLISLSILQITSVWKN